ncbi:MAG: [FeFe] hydrogenase H-cluster radical SAM maturase HydE [Clostridia bacterium]|nr:[FeFe] hydrogenase H-cluster radical SAM maturase HydE [Clostridia bacterium]
MNYTELVDKLRDTRNLTDEEFKALLETDEADAYLTQEADKVRRSIYGTDIYMRGLIEFTNYCKNNCYYCGIRRDNRNVERYRLDEETILNCANEGYKLGFRTIVLQGGEDPYYTDERLCSIIRKIKESHPDIAITLSVGEKEHDSYQAYFDAGADRYLLRHETADCEHYSKLHPSELTAEHRQKCLYDLKSIGFAVGAGIMIGSPYQTTEHIIKDLRFMQDLKPEMIGIGPFLSHKDTPFRDKENGSFELTIRLLAVLRLMFPYCLLPATTALGTINPLGREYGFKAGANVIMPNLSPTEIRKLYMLYDNKICTGDESAHCVNCIGRRAASVGYNVVISRGDPKKEE